MITTSEIFFQASRAPVAFASEKENSGGYTQEGRRGMCSDTVNAGGEVRGCSVGCMLGMSDKSPCVFIAAATRYMGFREIKKCFCKRGCFGCSEVFWYSDWHEIVLLFPLRVMPVSTLCRTLQAAAHCSPLYEAAAAKDALRAAVHVESCDTMLSRKAQSQAPPDNPETGDTYGHQSKER